MQSQAVYDLFDFSWVFIKRVNLQALISILIAHSKRTLIMQQTTDNTIQ